MRSSIRQAPVRRSSGQCRITKRASSGPLRRSRRLPTTTQQRGLAQELGRESGLPSPSSEHHQREQRKRKRGLEESQDIVHDVPQPKRGRPATDNQQDKPVVPHNDLVQAWVCNDSEWAKDLGNTTTMSDRNPRSRKRSTSSSSSVGRTQSSAGSRKWWDNRHFEQMRDGGLIMEEREGIVCTQQSQELCDRLLKHEELLPNDWFLEEPACRKILSEAGLKNEQRVERDLPPIICPSSELLSVRGYEGLERIKEGLDAEWTACTDLFGPKPKPDGSYGISRRAFTDEENEKLSFLTTAECEGSIFQFIVRQAKRSDGSLIKAERQAMHNASVACNTVVELFESIKAAEELDGQILAFSTSHNHETVRIFAHFPVFSATNKTFHRQLLYETNLSSLSSDLCRPYKITLGIFRHFFPRHLQRIKDALARRPAHSIGSFTARLSVDDEQQGETSTPPSSQEGGQSKRTSLASSVRLREENERLRVEVLRLVHMQQEQMEQQRLLLEQMREDAAEHRKQMAQQQTIVDLLQGKK